MGKRGRPDAMKELRELGVPLSEIFKAGILNTRHEYFSEEAPVEIHGPTGYRPSGGGRSAAIEFIIQVDDKFYHLDVSRMNKPRGVYTGRSQSRTLGPNVVTREFTGIESEPYFFIGSADTSEDPAPSNE